jgi:predicted phosphate transport protein (TIGR00153 family)
MAKKQDAYYFDTFVDCVDHACKAANILNNALKNYNPDTLEDCLNKIHTEEHSADHKKHELLNALIKAFITPIEREDILTLSQNIDETVDKIEDVLIRMYCNNIAAVRPDALELAELVVRSCDEVKSLMIEFKDFKRSKHLKEHIIEINNIEEKADGLFVNCMRNLHTTSTDPIEIITWRELYIYFEKCIDACEHVADTVESVIMKNS